MAGAQLEDGYTRIANEILESMARVKLSPTQYRLLFVIWRYTYGFQRKEHDMSLSFLSEATGCDKRSIQRELKSLEERKIIKQNIKSGSYRKISFNKVTDDWLDMTRTKSVGKTANGETANGETANGRVGEIANGTIGETANQERNIKEIYKENKEEEEKDPAKFFDKYIAPISPVIVQQIEDWENDLSPEIVIRAMKEAVYQNARNWKYINRILRDWYNKGAKNLNDVERLIKEFELQKNKKIARFQPRAVGSTYDPSKDRF